jgi:hypothetical protein
MSFYEVLSPIERGLGFFHLITGIWLMYLAYATVVDFALGFHWKV